MAQEAGGLFSVVLVLCLLERRETYGWRYSHEGPEHPSIAVCVEVFVLQVRVSCCESVVAGIDVCGTEMMSSDKCSAASPILCTWMLTRVTGEIHASLLMRLDRSNYAAKSTPSRSIIHGRNNHNKIVDMWTMEISVTQTCSPGQYSSTANRPDGIRRLAFETTSQARGSGDFDSVGETQRVDTIRQWVSDLHPWLFVISSERVHCFASSYENSFCAGVDRV